MIYHKLSRGFTFIMFQIRALSKKPVHRLSAINLPVDTLSADQVSAEMSAFLDSA